MKLERVAIAVLLVVVASQAIASCVDRRRRREERIAAANQLAASATQEDHVSGQLRIAMRYMYQGQVQLDRTQRERDQQAILAAAFQVEARELSGAAAIQPSFANDVLHIHSEWGSPDTNGVHVAADAALAGVAPIVGQPITGQMYFNVTLAPIPLKLGMACVGPNARFYVTGPRYAALVLERGIVTADVCNRAPPAWQPLSLRLPSLPWAAILFGGGLVTGIGISR